MMAQQQDTSTDSNTVVIGVVADPVGAPVQVAQQLAEDLPTVLSDQLPEGATWRVEVHREQLPRSDASHTEMMEVAAERMRQHGWDHAVCVTDLPLRSGKQPIVADASSSHCVVVASLPAFGGMRLRRRVRNVVAQLVADIRAPGTPSDDSEEHRRRRLPALGGRFQRVTPDQQGIDFRILASRGETRLLVGMVRANRPWQLVFGLTGPLVGAFAFSAFYIISTSVWQLAVTMGALRLSAAVIGSIAVMVTWLIVYHGLWEKITNRPAAERDEIMLFNASTVVSLTIGVGCMYLGLFVANLVAAGVVLTPQVFGQYVGADPGIGEYAVTMLLVTTAGTIAGAIGSGFESEDAIREAAYSYRERERRQALRDVQAQREDSDTDADRG